MTGIAVVCTCVSGHLVADHVLVQNMYAVLCQYWNATSMNMLLWTGDRGDAIEVFGLSAGHCALLRSHHVFKQERDPVGRFTTSRMDPCTVSEDWLMTQGTKLHRADPQTTKM